MTLLPERPGPAATATGTERNGIGEIGSVSGRTLRAERSRELKEPVGAWRGRGPATILGPRGAAVSTSNRSSIWRLATARGISDTGSWAATVALALVVYAKTGSTVWLSMSFFFTEGSAAVLAPIAGVIADRLNRKSVMIVCDLLGAACYIAMGLVNEPATLIAIGTVASVLHLPFGPSSSAAVPNLATEDDLSWANGVLSAAGGTGILLGPALAGALTGFLGGAEPVYWLNAASFVFSASLIATIKGRFSVAEKTEEPEERWHQMWAGWAYIARKPVLLTLTIIGAVTFIAAQ